MNEEKEKLDFYLQFKDKRKELKKELSNIDTSTKINIKYLNAIEDGDFDVLPTVYIRLFLRTYAEALELIPEKILKEYNEHINVSNQQLKTSGVTYIKEKTDKKDKLDNKKPLFDVSSNKLNNEEVCFVPRHGKGHRFNPTKINYRANIDSLKRLGVTDIVSVSAVGSLKEEMQPGDIVFADQYIDWTRGVRKRSFYDQLQFIRRKNHEKSNRESLHKNPSMEKQTRKHYRCIACKKYFSRV